MVNQMGIEEMKTNKLNQIWSKQELPTKTKPKNTEFQGEKGRDLLGTQADAKNVIFRSKSTLTNGENKTIDENIVRKTEKDNTLISTSSKKLIDKNKNKLL